MLTIHTELLANDFWSRRSYIPSIQFLWFVEPYGNSSHYGFGNAGGSSYHLGVAMFTLSWSRSIIIDFTWRNIKVLSNGDFEWLNTNTNSSYGGALYAILLVEEAV